MRLIRRLIEVFRSLVLYDVPENDGPAIATYHMTNPIPPRSETR